MKKRVIIGSRSSELALWQADFVAARLREFAPRGTEIAIKKIATKGDKILDVPLAKIGGKGLFTKEIESELANGTIDLAVHSLKDMPTVLPEGLTIGAYTEREEVRDAFVGKCAFADLPPGAVIGTASLRRQAQLLHLRPDLRIEPLRGNVNTRLRKFADGAFFGIVLATAGLNRLGLTDRITEILPTSVMLPAAGQGILAVEIRDNDTATKELIAPLNNNDSATAAAAERAFLDCTGGGCQVPVGAYAEITGARFTLTAMIAAADGSKMYRQTAVDTVNNARKCGKNLAIALKEAGGDKILAELLPQ